MNILGKFALLFLSFVPLSSFAVQIDGIFYEVMEGIGYPREVRVTYNPAKLTHDEYGQPIGNSYSGEVTVPPEVTIDGVTYRVTEIGKYAFAGNPDLTRVNLPETITKIDWAGFYRNDNLREMTLPSSLKSLELYAFRDCENLESINFPEGLEFIGGDAFTHDYALKEVILPSSIKRIDSFAFCGCTGVKTLILKDSDIPLEKIKSWGMVSVFERMAVDYAYIGRNVEDADDSRDNHIYIDAKELEIGGPLFKTFSGTVFKPESLEKLTVGPDVEYIPSNTFRNCINLREVVLLDGDAPLTIGWSDIGTPSYNSAFYFCPLEEVYLGRWLNKEYNTPLPFSYCFNLKSVIIGPSQTKIPDYSFLRCTALEDVDFPETFDELGEGCFSDCYSLEKVNLPPLVGNVPYRAFDACRNLKHVSFGELVESIDDSAFSGCSLAELNLPPSLRTIGTYAFSSTFNSFSVLNLPCAVESIGQYAFMSNSQITDIYCYAINAPSCRDYTFDNTLYDTCRLHVPENSKIFYQTANCWKNFKYIDENLVHDTDRIDSAVIAGDDGAPVKSVYNLAGVRFDVGNIDELQSLPPGVYVVNGKKITIFRNRLSRNVH